ncbi:MAG: hypothetical protein LBJ35_00325 [Spirochaetaceae bacterium]|nr:hypothetical protein [Spirochaetaceae bacterium]
MFNAGPSAAESAELIAVIFQLMNSEPSFSGISMRSIWEILREYFTEKPVISYSFSFASAAGIASSSFSGGKKLFSNSVFSAGFS